MPDCFERNAFEHLSDEEGDVADDEEDDCGCYGEAKGCVPDGDAVVLAEDGELEEGGAEEPGVMGEIGCLGGD